MIPFGDYLPDLPPYQNPGATMVKNVVPSGLSYRQFPSQSAQTNALSARCQGAVAGRDNDGNVYNFAGDESALYQLSNATWSDVSGAVYTIDGAESWQFAQWGEDMIATNINDNMQKFTMGTDAAFSNLITVVKARFIAVVRDFLVIGNTNDSTDGAVPHRVRWAGQDSSTDWAVSSVTQADYNDLNAGNGWVYQIVGGAYGTIFQERAISRMTYVGSPLIFQFDLVEQGRGTLSPNSVIKFGDLIAYLGNDGFYIFDGARSVPIGVNKVDKTFYGDLDPSYLDRVYGVHDPINRILIWCYPGASHSGIPNRFMLYDYASEKWGYAEAETEVLTKSLSQGYTLDTLDSYNSSLDAIGVSLDSRFWTGGNIVLSGFNSDHKQTAFTGDALDAVLETTESEITPGRRTNLQRVRPMIDGGTTTIQVGHRNNLADAITWSNALSLSNGSATPRINSRYHRIRLNVTGGFNYAQGVDLEAKRTGRR